MQAVHAEVDGRALAGLYYFLLHLTAHFLATTSSMRAGWMRPSTTSWWSAKGALSRGARIEA